jgi:hypothetical protein
LGREIPACGGGYLKLFPFWFTSKAFTSISKTQPANLYMHPYEIDTSRYPDYYYEEIKKQKLIQRFKMNLLHINKGTVLNKLDKLLSNFSFDTMGNIIADCSGKGALQTVSLTEFLP